MATDSTAQVRDSRTSSAPTLAPGDIRTDQPTRTATLKWVIVVDAQLGPGLIANATACLAAAVGNAIPGLLGPDGADATGNHHPGLPWAGCAILAADPATLADLRTRATGNPRLHLVDMPEAAQTSRVYDDYLATLAGTDPTDLRYRAISIVGPRNKIDKLVGKLPLLR
jgi:hypothetical protein